METSESSSSYGCLSHSHIVGLLKTINQEIQRDLLKTKHKMNGFDLGSGKLHSFLHGIIRPGDKALMDKGLIISKFYAVNKKKIVSKGLVL